MAEVDEVLIGEGGGGLDLIHRGQYVGLLEQFGQVVPLEVAHADRTHAALRIELLHGGPCLLPAFGRPVDQIQIHIVQAEPVQALLECILGAVFANVVVPQFRGDEQVCTVHIAFGDGLAHRSLVAVYARRVDMAVPVLEGGAYGVHGLWAVLDLEHAEAYLRDHHVVVERDAMVLLCHDSSIHAGKDGEGRHCPPS